MKQIVILFFFFIGFGAKGNNPLFEKAAKAYNQGQYQIAIEAYEKILSQQQHSANLYFNLANAHYKLNHIAFSIYYYEKALLLDPKDEDIRNNLIFAQNRTIDVIDKLPQSAVVKFKTDFIHLLKVDQWAIIAIVFMVLFVSLFILYRNSFIINQKRIALISSFVAVIGVLIAVSMAFTQQSIYKKDRPAIVFAEKIQVQSAPNLKSEQVFTIHEGTKVNVLDDFENWKQIKLSNGSTGWLLAADIKELKK